MPAGGQFAEPVDAPRVGGGGVAAVVERDPGTGERLAARAGLPHDPGHGADRLRPEGEGPARQQHRAHEDSPHAYSSRSQRSAHRLTLVSARMIVPVLSRRTLMVIG